MVSPGGRPLTLSARAPLMTGLHHAFWGPGTNLFGLFSCTGHSLMTVLSLGGVSACPHIFGGAEGDGHTRQADRSTGQAWPQLHSVEVETGSAQA